MVYVFLADGFEEIEALCPIDIMRRAGIDVVTVSVPGGEYTTGSHNITIKTDLSFEQFKIDEIPEMLVLPGGMPGAKNLSEDKRLASLLCQTVASGGKVAAICAAPFILGELGILNGKHATCYPGYESSLKGAIISAKNVVRDGNIITAIGMGASIEFGLALVCALHGRDASDKIAAAIHARGDF